MRQGFFKTAARVLMGAPPEPPAEEWRPLGLHPKCTVQLDWTQVFLAREAGACFPELQRPPGSLYGLDGVGTMVLFGGTVRVDRYYLDDDQDGSLVVEVESHMPRGDATLPTFACARLHARLLPVRPADEDEWAAWLDPRLGIIGKRELVRPEDYGHSTPYVRVVSPEIAKNVPAIYGTEKYSGVDGEYTMERQMMLYARDLPDPANFAEYAYVASISTRMQPQNVGLERLIERSVAIELPQSAITAR